MSRSPDAVSWSGINTVFAILLTVSVAVVGGGFAWLHSDLGDMKTDVGDTRNSVTTVTDKVSAIATQVAVTNTKLDTINDELRKHH
jgi:multidrug resistance efflux pump